MADSKEEKKPLAWKQKKKMCTYKCRGKTGPLYPCNLHTYKCMQTNADTICEAKAIYEMENFQQKEPIINRWVCSIHLSAQMTILRLRECLLRLKIVNQMEEQQQLT